MNRIIKIKLFTIVISLLLYNFAFALESESNIFEFPKGSKMYWETPKNSCNLNPNNNCWSSKNVYIDKDGNLHLQFKKGDDNKWYASEIKLAYYIDSNGKKHEKVKYGTYQFYITSDLSSLNSQLVLGLFTYPPEDNKPKHQGGSNEIDIEYAHFETGYNLWFTVWPNAFDEYKNQTIGNTFTYNGPTVQEFVWKKRKVIFNIYDKNFNLLKHDIIRRKPPKQKTPKLPAKLHLNLWMRHADKDTYTGENVDIIIKDIKYIPSHPNKKSRILNL